MDGKELSLYLHCELGSKNQQGGLSSPEAVDKDAFYLTPLPKVLADPTKPWFEVVPVGRNRLNVLLKEMCAEAAITTNYANHSLRACGVTTMFQAGVPEELLKQQTDHRSLETLRQYEHTSES